MRQIGEWFVEDTPGGTRRGFARTESGACFTVIRSAAGVVSVVEFRCDEALWRRMIEGGWEKLSAAEALSMPVVGAIGLPAGLVEALSVDRGGEK